MQDIIKQFVLLWSVIDPIGTIPVFLALASAYADPGMRRRLAIKATFIAALVLLFFVVAGEFLLDAMSIPLPAFQIAGGIVLFIFAMTMMFGDSKPESELDMIKKGMQTAVFPLAIPSIASPGAMMAAVLLTDNHRFSIEHQVITTLIILAVLLITLVFMLLGNYILKVIGEAGASVISRIMGLILASVAVNAVLVGIQTFFHLQPFSGGQ
ncbi:MAG: MarC family protein [Thalassolituus sp.]